MFGGGCLGYDQRFFATVVRHVGNGADVFRRFLIEQRRFCDDDAYDVYLRNKSTNRSFADSEVVQWLAGYLCLYQ